MLNLLKNSLLALWYPKECPICRESVENSSDGAACDSCWTTTRLFTKDDALCSKCGAFLAETRLNVESLCRNCDAQHFDQARAIGVYHGALAASIVSLKTTPVTPKRLCDSIFASFERTGFDGADLIIPVPLSAKRFHERGFNQAESIARAISRHFTIPLDNHSLARIHHTPIHRVGMDRKARHATVKNSFSVLRPKLVAGRRVELVDDVFTTGSTVSECARVLKKNGAARVTVFTLGRAVDGRS